MSVDTLCPREAGVDDYVTKPFSPEALGERVQAALPRDR